MDLFLFQRQHFTQPHPRIKEQGQQSLVPDGRKGSTVIVIQHVPDLVLIEGEDLHLGLFNVSYPFAWVCLNVALLRAVLEKNLV